MIASYYAAAKVSIMVGLALVIASTFGMLQIRREHNSRSTQLIALVIVCILSLEITVIALSATQRHNVIVGKLHTKLNSYLLSRAQDRRGMECWDIIQSSYGCCGLMSHLDWLDDSCNTTQTASSLLPTLSVEIAEIAAATPSIPNSCICDIDSYNFKHAHCIDLSRTVCSTEMNTRGLSTGQPDTPVHHIYNESCYAKVKGTVLFHLHFLLTLTSVITTVHSTHLIFTIILVCRINKLGIVENVYVVTT